MGSSANPARLDFNCFKTISLIPTIILATRFNKKKECFIYQPALSCDACIFVLFYMYRMKKIERYLAIPCKSIQRMGHTIKLIEISMDLLDN